MTESDYSLTVKKLPIGIQTFRDIIENDYLYIDKTQYIFSLVKSGKGAYFFSRPRRFGKSLLLSALEEIFLGNKELFKGLWIYDSEYNWKKYPVIRIDYSTQKSETVDQLKKAMIYDLDRIAFQYKLVLTEESYELRFKELIHKLSDSFGKVVILIDEYDKPIIDWLEKPDLAKEMRSVLKGFFSVLKGNDANIRFLLLTGVSKFSKAGVFSDLNQLEDITLRDEYSSMLGIAEEELLQYFQGEIKTFAEKEKTTEDVLIEKIRFWYNGFRFSPGGTSVYNPFSTLLLFSSKRFSHHWFETGTPSFLVNLILTNNYDIMKIPLELEEIAFSVYEIENLSLAPLLIQTGYLTIKDYDKETMVYTLDYPNFEVKKAFLNYIMDRIGKGNPSSSAVLDLVKAFNEGDIDRCMEILREVFINIDYDIQIHNEKYYQTVFYLIFTLLGLKIFTEVKTNLGRIDAAAESRSSVYIFEFKLNGTKEEALTQIRTKKYYEKYLNRNKPVFLIGAEFRNKNIGDYIIETL